MTRSSKIKGKVRSTDLEKIQSILIQPWYDLGEVLRVPLRERRLVIRKRLDSWPDFVVGSSEEPGGAKTQRGSEEKSVRESIVALGG